ncbi:hypothetical protein GV791_07005 [Nocardia cyriacigeorgica]|uniref:Uncharacterized protein n=1 Tax=Nocardia cyriacigeorgica TaxID=135487 RepID=A0A6P1CID1_9NOCA|nr:hypothetical protein [Nocardia cyriacigeorgica]MBF6084214.1 hypothetical protein [Nocardia cyriacigeorgica]MBF6286831.1 hypothetical protein [Nocardia cyriacigeorgica]MBF6426658.1 hypothetical protein [Nocardia cyriacigeorgica]NEW32310.1 hypothetical protein [Nocardia cyriacigeorgica]
MSGPGEALALAMVGRTAALDDLTGEGVAELRRRCAREQAGPGSRGRWASACRPACVLMSRMPSGGR